MVECVTLSESCYEDDLETDSDDDTKDSNVVLNLSMSYPIIFSVFTIVNSKFSLTSLEFTLRFLKVLTLTSTMVNPIFFPLQRCLFKEEMDFLVLKTRNEFNIVFSSIGNLSKWICFQKNAFFHYFIRIFAIVFRMLNVPWIFPNRSLTLSSISIISLFLLKPSLVILHNVSMNVETIIRWNHIYQKQFFYHHPC